MKIGSPSLTYRGRLYVTPAEFASRVQGKKSYIQELIRRGKIRTTTLNGYKAPYIDWDSQSIVYEGIKQKDIKDSLGMSIGKVREQRMDSSAIPAIQTPSIQTPSTDSWIDTSKINPWKYPECWIRDEEQNYVLNPETNAPSIDYDLLKQYLTAQRYQLDIEEKRGKYIDKNELSRSMMSIAKIISANLDAIPQRYGSIIVASCENITGHSFDDAEKKSIINILKDEAGNIMNSVKNEIEQLVDDSPEPEEQIQPAPLGISKIIESDKPQKKKRGRPRKEVDIAVPDSPKRGRGRPRKEPLVIDEAPKRKRGRPKKNE